MAAPSSGDGEGELWDELGGSSLPLPEDLDDLPQDDRDGQANYDPVDIEEDTTERVKRLKFTDPLVSRALLPHPMSLRSDEVRDAALSHGLVSVPSLPWESGIMKVVFGTGSLSSLPSLPAVPMEQGDAVLSVAEPAEDVPLCLPELPVFASSVRFRMSFKAGATDRERDLALRRWRTILLVVPECSSTGLYLESMDDEGDQFRLLEEVFLGKSSKTLTKRANCMRRYMRFWDALLKDAGYSFLPVTAEASHSYVQSLRGAQRYSGIREFVETLRFCEHVIGVTKLEGDVAPWTKGIIRDSYRNRHSLKQSRTLTVSEAIQLENFVINGPGHLVDRFGAGAMLFLLYARGRVSDVRNLMRSLVDDEGVSRRHGYLECSTQDHKNSRVTLASGLPLLLVAPLFGLKAEAWGLKFIEVALQLGVDLRAGHVGPLLGSPDALGTLSARPITTGEVTSWLNNLLRKLGGEVREGLTSHGLKATSLSWCSKAGLSEQDRHILGHHSLAGKRTMAAYSREMQVAPLRHFESVLDSIRHGNFYPDASRSGMFLNTAATKEEAPPQFGNVPDVPEPDSVSPVTEGDNPAADREDNALEVEASSSATTSSSSDSESGQDDEVAVRNLPAGTSARSKSFVWKANCTVYQHKRTWTLHLLPSGGSSATFLCGRKNSSDHVLFQSPVYSENWKCRQCDGCQWLSIMEARKRARAEPQAQAH